MERYLYTAFTRFCLVKIRTVVRYCKLKISSERILFCKQILGDVIIGPRTGLSTKILCLQRLDSALIIYW